MPQIATLARRADPSLNAQQLRAVQHLVAGDTVTRTADAAGVARETVHRWCREDWGFQAAVNAARRDLRDAVERRLVAVAEKAVRNVGEAVERGDLRASIAVLKGLGALGGTLPGIGSDDPQILAGEAARREQMATAARAVADLYAAL